MWSAVTGSAAVAERRLVYPSGVIHALQEQTSTVTHPRAASKVGFRARALRFVPRRSDWSRATIGRDLSAGLMVALVALPLALGFGVASGVGAAAGITTAIVAGILAAVFGGSNVQVSGPTGAMTVVLIPIVAAHGADGVLVVGILAGLMLLVLAVTGAGRAMKYMPLPVVEGFTAGIAVIIALQQLPAALGVDVDGEKVLGLAWGAITAWLGAPAWQAHVMTLLVAAGIVIAARVRSGFPAALVLVAAATAINMLAGGGLKTIGYIPSTLPALRWPQIPWEHLDSLLLAAVAVAALGALESLLSATVADAMTVGDRHDPDRELFGQGIANVVAPLFGGIPATAAIARTAVNVRAGAGSRLAAVFHSLLLLVAVLVAARWVGEIPLAALAGVLIGLVVAGFFALRDTARTAVFEATPLDKGDHRDEERELLDEHIAAFRVEGPSSLAQRTISSSSSPRCRGSRSSCCACATSRRSTPPAPRCSRKRSGASSAEALGACSPLRSPSTFQCCANSASSINSRTRITPSTTPSTPSPTPGCTSPAFSTKNPTAHP